MGKVTASVPGVHGKMAKRSIYHDARALLSLVGIKKPTIVDGGACVGSTTQTFLKLWPNCVVHAFEGRPDLAKGLRKQFRDKINVKVYNFALGEVNGSTKFNITKYIGTGSVLSPSAQSARYNGQRVEIVDTVNVPMVRIDKMVPKADMIKLDIQGGEVGAINGIGTVMDRIKIIVTEVMFYAAYKDQPLFCEINSLLEGYGFQLFNLYNLSTHKLGKLTAGDALFINNLYYNRF